MKYFVILFLSSLLFIACSSSKELEVSSYDREPCNDQGMIPKLSDSREFTGETADSLLVYQNGDKVYASVNVRSYCNARILFDIERNENTIDLKIYNGNTNYDDCVCIRRVSAEIQNVDEGSYTIRALSQDGRQLFDQAFLTVEEN